MAYHTILLRGRQALPSPAAPPCRLEAAEQRPAGLHDFSFQPDPHARRGAGKQELGETYLELPTSHTFQVSSHSLGTPLISLTTARRVTSQAGDEHTASKLTFRTERRS
jgi:hypothetical protein